MLEGNISKLTIICLLNDSTPRLKSFEQCSTVGAGEPEILQFQSALQLRADSEDENDGKQMEIWMNKISLWCESNSKMK